MVRGDLTEFFWLRLSVNITIYSIAILYIYPRLTRWFFKTYNDNVTQFIFILALVFLASYMAQVIGLEAILGAFFAGIVLNRFIPNVSPLMNRLEFVGNALFIPYFLIGVGMLIDLRVIFKSTETIIVAVNMSVVATICKWLAAWLTQKTCHMTKSDRQLIFGLSNAQAAATLAAIETDRGNAEKALQLLHRVMDGQTLSTRHAALHLLRARALWQQGRKDEARAAVNEYLYLAGNGPSAQALAEPPFNSMGKRV